MIRQSPRGLTPRLGFGAILSGKVESDPTSWIPLLGYDMLVAGIQHVALVRPGFDVWMYEDSSTGMDWIAHFLVKK